MLDAVGHRTVQSLGYPSRTVLYHWIGNDDAAGKRVEGKIFSHYPPGIKGEAIRLVEEGLSNSEAASCLCVSSPTVVYHWVKTTATDAEETDARSQIRIRQ